MHGTVLEKRMGLRSSRLAGGLINEYTHAA